VRGRRVRRVAVAGGLAVLLSAALSVGAVDHGSALPEVAPLQVPVSLLRTAARVHPPTVTWQDVSVGGVRRRYLLALPPTAAGSAVRRPLVVVFHGLWQHPLQFAQVTGLLADARAEGVVLAVPDALNGAFNDGRFGRRGPNDDAFFLALRAQLVHRGIVDPHRVTVAGFSNGAGMAMEIASRHPGAVAALVSVCGELLAAPGSARPHSPVTTVLIHGTRDRLQPWDGRPRWGHWMAAYVSVPTMVDSFVDALGRHRAATEAAVAGARPFEGHPGVTVQTWHGSGGHSVTFYTLAGFGHAWPVRHPAPAVARPSGAPSGHRHGRIVATSAIDASAITVTMARTARTG
jgi:polyhydroxybutyrate depolymerase